MKTLILEIQTNGLFNGLFDNIASPDINNKVFSTTAAMVGVALGIAGICALIQIAIEIGKRFSGATTEGYSAFLTKYAVMALCLVLYMPLMKMVDYTMTIPTLAMKAAGVASAEKLHNARVALYSAPQTTDGSTLATITGNLKATSNVVASATNIVDPSSWSKIFLNSLIQWIAEIIDVVVFLIRQYLLNVMFVCGPLALAFSFIKNMEGSFMSFFKYYIVVHLWATIAFVLDNIYTELTIADLQGTSQWFNNGVPSFDTLVYQIGFIILHCMIPKLADMLISGSQGGAFFSAAAGFATKGISSLGKGATSVASGGAAAVATAAASVKNSYSGTK
jgi:hypothetical protein